MARFVSRTQKQDIGTLEGLAAFAESKGYFKEAKKAKKPKLSFFQRLGRGLTAFETGNALYQSRYDNGSFLGTYLKDITTGLSEAVTGKKIRLTEKKIFKDILVKEGAKDRPGKLDTVDITGFIGDVLTDPLTFFGGFLGRGAAKGAGIAIKGAEKIPKVGKAVIATRMATENLFKPFAELLRMGKVGEDYVGAYTKFVKGTRALQDDFLDQTIKIAKGTRGIEGAGRKIGTAIETGGAKSAIKVFRGGEALDISKIGDRGLPVTLDKGVAKIFLKGKKDFRKSLPFLDAEKVGLETFFISPTAKIATKSDIPTNLFKAYKETNPFINPEKGEAMLGRWAKQNGFDAIDYRTLGKTSAKEAEIKIFNPDILFKKRPTSTGVKVLDEALNALVERQGGMTKLEKTRGILRSELPDYMHHMLTPEASDFLNHKGDISVFIKNISSKLGAAKERKISGVVTDINKSWKTQHGFNLFEEDAFKAFSKRGLDSIKKVQSFDFLQRIGNQFGKKAEKDFIDDIGIKWVGTSLDELSGIKVPEQIAKHLKELKTFLSNDESTKGFLKMYDKIQGIWKGTVTGWFPAFHTRNAIGGTFNNWIAGVKNPALYKMADDIVRGKSGKITIKGTEVPYATVRQLMKENGVVGQTGYLDVFEYLKKGVGETGLQKFSKAPQRVMGYFEDRMRGTLFIDSLKKGLTPEAAAKRVIKFHFDYMPEGFTAFEKTVMRRLIPFYTWTRHNIPLQLEQMVMQPGKYAGVFKSQRAFGIQEGGEEESILPSWLKDRFTVKGEGGYWSGLGLPLEEATEKLANPLRGFGVSLSPLVKVPIERLTGYNIFKDRRISEDYYGKQYKNAPKPIQDWLQLKKRESSDGDVYYTVNPQRRYWLEVVGTRGLSTGLKLADVSDDSKNLLSLITTIRQYNYSVEDLKRWSDSDARKALEELLLRKGELSEFSRTYVPK